jgi:hypothetical protein
LAVIDGVPGTFFATGTADFSAELAEAFGEGALAGHHPGGQDAHAGAIDVQLNAAGHFLNLIFTQAGRCAVFAGDGAVGAALDAGRVVGWAHRSSPVQFTKVPRWRHLC